MLAVPLRAALAVLLMFCRPLMVASLVKHSDRRSPGSRWGSPLIVAVHRQREDESQFSSSTPLSTEAGDKVNEVHQGLSSAVLRLLQHSVSQVWGQAGVCEDTPLRTGPPLELVQSGPRLLRTPWLCHDVFPELLHTNSKRLRGLWTGIGCSRRFAEVKLQK